MGVYAFRARAGWDWRGEFPRLALVSLITTAYGATDYVLLLPAIVAALAALPRLAATWSRLAGWLGYGALNLCTLFLWRYPALVYEGESAAPVTLAFFLRPSILWYVMIPPLWWGWFTLWRPRALQAESV